jgi:hypothetical protein
MANKTHAFKKIMNFRYPLLKYLLQVLKRRYKTKKNRAAVSCEFALKNLLNEL